MEPDDRTFVIVGASLAGAKAAEALRKESYTGRIVLVGEERNRPYERPPLSKGYLLGNEELSSAYVHEESWYADHDVDLRTSTRAITLDRDAHQVELEGGERLDYTKVLLTTGAVPRKLPVAGGKLAGVHYLRRMGDAERLLEELQAGGRRVVVVGGGWIGLETAAAARTYDNEVTLVEPQRTPLHAALGPELGEMFAELHREHGVDLRLGVGVSEFSGDEQVAAVRTATDDELPADVVIVGVGTRPRTDLAEAAGLDVDKQTGGVTVDEHLCTSDPDVFAAGDIASAYNPLLGRRIRVEHWQNARKGGAAAARSMLDPSVVYDEVPYFFTDQYDLGMEFLGHAEPGSYDDVAYRGDREAREFIAFWLRGGRVVAGMNVNVWDVTKPIRALIRSGKSVDTDRLTDTDTPLTDLTS